MAHEPGLHHLRDGAHRLLDRHRGVHAGEAVDVHVVRAQPLQRVGEEVLDRGRAAVDAVPASGGVAERPELHAQDAGVTGAAGERLAQEELVVAHPVEVAGVEERDAGVEGGVDRGQALRPVGGPVEVRHPHAAETHGRDPGAHPAERARVHSSSS